MTPMIDVVFLLLVFFVCASVGQKPDQLLPATIGAGTTDSSVKASPPADDEWNHQQVRVRLTTSTGGDDVVVQLNEQPVRGFDDLEHRLRGLAAADPLSPVILDVDDLVEVRHFIRIYDLCQALKFERISFAAKSESGVPQSGTGPNLGK